MTEVDCLGEGEYQALVRRRRTSAGQSHVLGDLTTLFGAWGRTLNGTSTAGCTVPISGLDGGDCCEVLNEIQPGRDNLEISRDGEQVWAGPIRAVTGDPNTGNGEIVASDYSLWAQLRLFLHTMKPRDVDLASIFEGYVNYALHGALPPWGLIQAGDPPLYTDNIEITVSTHPTGVTGDRTVAHHDLKIVSGELDELARTGCDWTVTNNQWWIGGLVILTDGAFGPPLALPGYLTDEHFRTQPRIRKTLEGMATDVWIRGNGVRGHVGGPDPRDGVEIVRVLDEYSIEDTASALAAARTYHDRASNPIVYVEGNNALEPSAPIDVQHLIPGALARTALAGGGCVMSNETLRLESVSANWNDKGEEITVALQPQGTSGDAVGPG